MKYKILLTSTAIYAVCLSALAAVPCEWSATPQRPAPAQFDRFHGESLDFRCTFTGFGALPFDGASDVRLWYQTNGMGAAWWSIPATVSSNILTATFTPDRDPGAERLAVFFGAPSNAYAAAQVRFRNSPGATPNDLQPPSVLDWQAELSAATNALATNVYTKAETDAKIVELSPPGITTDDVRNIATNEVSLSDGLCWAYVLSSDVFKVSYGPTYDENHWMIGYRQRKGMGWTTYLFSDDPPDAPHVRFENSSLTIDAIRVSSTNRNELGFVRYSDLSNMASAIVKVGATKTNEVCSIVTNETPATYGPWMSDNPGYPGSHLYWYEPPDGSDAYWTTTDGSLEGADLDYDFYTTRIDIDWEGEQVVYFRSYTPPLNVLGLARLVDLPPLTNGLVSAATATNIANSATNFLTRSEAEAGFTEWKLSGVPNGATKIYGPDFVYVEPPMYSLFFKYNEVEYEGWTDVSGEDVTSVVFDCTDVDDTVPHIIVTATRHRITTTALSQLTNDVGFITSPTVTNIVNKAYVESLGIESGVSEATVTNVVRSIAYAVNDYVWDGDVCWRRQMLQGGYLEYVAVTNIDVTLPENYKALEALENERRRQ